MVHRHEMGVDVDGALLVPEATVGSLDDIAHVVGGGGSSASKSGAALFPSYLCTTAKTRFYQIL